MSQGRRRASAGLIGARLFAFGCSMVTAVVLARLLHPSGYGIYAAGLAVVGLVTLLGPFGVDQLLLTGRATVGASQAALNRLFLFTSSIVGTAAWLWPGVNQSERVTIAWLGLSATADHLRRGWYAEPQRLLHFGVRARREVTVIATLTVITLGSAAMTGSATYAAAANALTSLFLCLPTIRWVRDNKRTPDQIDAPQGQINSWRAALHAGFPFALSAASYTAYIQMGGALLVALGQPLDVAYFRVAWTFFLGAIVIPVALNNDILRPRVYALQESNEFLPLLFRFAWINLLLSAAYATGLVIFGRLAIPIVFGAQYRPAVQLLPWLAAIIPLNFLSTCVANGLVGLGVVWRVVGNQFYILVICTVASFRLIPSSGAVGALQALVIAEGAGLLSVLVLLRLKLREFKPPSPASTGAFPGARG